MRSTGPAAEPPPSPAAEPPSGPTAEFAGRTGAVLQRLQRSFPALIDLSLDRLRRLLAALGHPEHRLPPVIHVAGTNGKGSTCAHLRAIAEAAGWRVHATTSPHLVDVRERFRVAGRLVGEEALLDVLARVERINAGAPITVFEVLIACALVLFSEQPAELAVLEVGLGGRFDATNVVERPAACAIASISMDHEAFLGDTVAKIAGEKAGIIKPGCPVVTGRQLPEVVAVLEREAAAKNAPLLRRDRDWWIEPAPDGLRYRDAAGALMLPPSGLSGPHQVDNAGLAVAALRFAGRGGGIAPLPDAAYAGIAAARWPARMQRLHGRLAAILGADWELWLDGGHNPGAGAVLADVLRGWDDRPVHLVVGMKQTKDPAGFLRPLLPLVRGIRAVAERDQHLAMPVAAIVAASAGIAMPTDGIADALRDLSGSVPTGRVLICGSLYLAGVALKLDGTLPD